MLQNTLGAVLALCAVLLVLTPSAVLGQHIGKNVLVLLPQANQRDQYSLFLDSLSARGFNLDVKGAKDSSIKFKSYGTWLYDHLVILSPKAEGFGGDLSASAVTDFVDSGHSVILAASSEVSETIRSLAAEFGVDVDDKGTRVYDHFQHASLEGSAPDHTLVAATEVVDSPAFLPTALKGPVLFRGIASASSDSDLATVVLSAPMTAYSHDPRKPMLEPPSLLAGSTMRLVTAVQARNNARMLVAGSVDMFSNALFEATATVGGQTGPTGNKEFCEGVAAWTLQAQGVIMAENLRHHLIGSEEQPSHYRVTDDVEFLVDIYEHVDGQKVPYKANDVQMEFTMLDPHVRVTLRHNGASTYSLAFKVPDVYGVFKYTIQYRHLGYSYLKLSHQVPVRPFKHNEYERFLFCAYPYYASAMSSMGAFFVLGFFFLYHKP